MVLDEEQRLLLEAAAKKRGLGGLDRHIFLCIGPECCSAEAGEVAWKHLKARIAELNLGAKVYRSKVGCLRICTSGPIAVVYPEGTWYRDLNSANIDRVVDQHLRGGKPVQELVFATNPL